MKAAAEELGFEIEVDESLAAEKPAKNTESAEPAAEPSAEVQDEAVVDADTAVEGSPAETVEDPTASEGATAEPSAEAQEEALEAAQADAE